MAAETPSSSKFVAQAALVDKPSSSILLNKSRVNKQLKHLTDYFPNQDSSEYRLTRSRVKAEELSRQVCF